MPSDSKLEQYVTESRPRFEQTLREFVAIPTVSTEPERKPEIARGAQFAAELLRGLGAQAEIASTPGNPIVLGSFTQDGKLPTLTVYNHIDVQPATEPQWLQSPFELSVKDGRYGGRGTTDDKGPALATLLAAKYAVDNGVALNLRFIWELEEEIGSPHFDAFVAAKREELRTDSVLVSDTIWISRNVPALPYSLRGMQGVLLSLRTAEHDVHSGTTGGASRNPLGELCQVIDQCYEAKSGRILIPGFYDDVEPPSEEEMRSFVASGFDLTQFKQDHGLHSLRTNDARELLMRIWGQPTFEVHGISGGYQGPGIKTIVPAAAEAKISMRLVPRQDPPTKFRQLQEFVKTINPDVEVKSAHYLEPYLGDYRGPYQQAAAASLQEAFGQKPSFVREGGSIGAVVSMQRHLQAPIVLMGLSLPEHGYHAPNEFFDWGQAAGGMKAFVRYFERAAELGRRGKAPS